MVFSFRRQVIAALAGLGLIVAALVATAGANIQGFSQKDPAQHASTYVEAMIGAPRFVNPLLAASDTDTDLTHLVYSGLTRVDTNGKLALDLANEWQISPDGRVYTFTLKPGLRWHDGEAVTSADVVATIDLLHAAEFPGDPALAARWRGVSVGAVSTDVVTFTLPISNSAFLQNTTLGLLPKHLWSSVKPSEIAASELNQAPIGSGPWRYVRDVSARGAENPSGTPVPGGLPAGEGVLLEPNPYSLAEKPRISRIWFRLYPSFGAALSGLRLGEVHGLGHIPTDRVAEVATLPGVGLHLQGLARYNMLILNDRSPLFKDVQTRRAIELAIDRDALVRQSLSGEGRPIESPILPNSWAYDPSVTVRPYDPSEARRLLDLAGWKEGPGGVRVRDGVTMTVSLAANSDIAANVVAAKQLEGYLEAIGIDVKLALVSRDVLVNTYLMPRAFHMALAGWEASGSDPDVLQYWHSSQANVPGGLNFSGWSNPAADKALQAALQTQDQSERAKAYAAFQQAFYAEIPSVILYQPLYSYATRAPASGISLPSGDMLTAASRFDTVQNWSLEGSR